MYKICLIGGGGFIGSILRYLVGLGVQRFFAPQTFLLGTLCVNIIGCFFIGLLNGLANGRIQFSEEARGFFFIGLLGGFTTFSSFAFETYTLARTQHLAFSLANIAAQIVFGLAAVWLGHVTARSFL